MRFFTLQLTSIFALCQVALAEKWHVYSDAEYEVMACKMAVQKYGTWCSSASLTKGYKCACKTKPELGSWLDCIHNFSSDIEKAQDIVIDYCAEVNITVTTASLEAAYENATSYIVDYTTVDGYNATKVIDYPIKGGKIQSLAKKYVAAYQNRYGNVTTSHYLGIALLSAWGALMVVCGLANWTQRLFPSVTRKFTGPSVNAYRRYLTMPAFFKRHHVESFGLFGFVPDRFEAIVITIFLVYCGLASGILGYHYQKGDPVFLMRSTGLSRYIGDRACILASYIMPLLFIFPGRNNLLQYLTRWKYSRFVTLHKWVARIFFLEILLHAVAMIIQSGALGKWHSRLLTNWYREGFTALVASIIIVALAGYTIRRRYYEFFLISHIILIAMFLYTTWLHAGSQGYETYSQAAAAVWCFDRFIRLVRLALFGIRTARCEILSEEGTIKLSIPFPKSYWKPYPGAHGFVHFMTPTTFWQSHPFTLIESITDKDHIHFYCKVKGGVTRALHEKINKEGKSVFNIKVMVEGPYGEQSPYQNYDKAVLIAGGNGIPGPFSYALDLMSKDVKTEVKLYWAVREYNVLNWFKEELAQFRGTKCKPIIYVSNTDSQITDVDFNLSSASSTDNSSSEEKGMGTTTDEKTIEYLQELFDFVEFRSGRIDVEQLIKDEIAESSGSIAFGACAHPNMVDHLRATIGQSLNTHSSRIDYYEEMQAW